MASKRHYRASGSRGIGKLFPAETRPLLELNAAEAYIRIRQNRGLLTHEEFGVAMGNAYIKALHAVSIQKLDQTFVPDRRWQWMFGDGVSLMSWGEIARKAWVLLRGWQRSCEGDLAQAGVVVPSHRTGRHLQLIRASRERWVDYPAKADILWVPPDDQCRGSDLNSGERKNRWNIRRHRLEGWLVMFSHDRAGTVPPTDGWTDEDGFGVHFMQNFAPRAISMEELTKELCVIAPKLFPMCSYGAGREFAPPLFPSEGRDDSRSQSKSVSAAPAYPQASGAMPSEIIAPWKLHSLKDLIDKAA
eukprot:gnl/TRDRNA2_/TRDRNA2_115775_c2_seq1.p1 gnl/TRDRNA2_/TRDRNA2_115775_c2~~gnl/TRDRNA2_/TRDRNA2_115775_c2_seq1.p1  ORF type:complete len:332 (+),score=33.30 gnl/TRDRNA2_/TRDRNA2_115775_c2_seq1:88-996(+)